MESCGVSQCENGGELWMCVTIRFPMLPGSVFSIELTDFLDSDLSPQGSADGGLFWPILKVFKNWYWLRPPKLEAD